MLRKIQAIVGCAVLLCLGIGLASAQPATAPAAQTLPPVDATTPKGALKMYSRATQNGDSLVLRQLMLAATPQEQKIVEVLVRRAEVAAKLRQALVKAFGEDVAEKFTGVSDAAESVAESRIEQMAVEVKDSKAMLQLKGGVPGDVDPGPVEMVNVDGKWKLPLGPMAEGMSDEDLDRSSKRMMQQADLVLLTAEEVASGKFKSPEEVTDAIKGRLASAILAEAAAAPATRPSTAPAGGR